MDELRLGDIIDDYCVKCRRMTNHAIVSIVDGEAAKVRCRSCYHDHTYLKEQIPPSKKDLKKLELYNAVLAGAAPDAAPDAAAPDAEAPAVDSEPVTAPDAPAADDQSKKPRGRAKKA
jgi:hypothetical protein